MAKKHKVRIITKPTIEQVFANILEPDEWQKPKKEKKHKKNKKVKNPIAAMSPQLRRLMTLATGYSMAQHRKHAVDANPFRRPDAQTQTTADAPIGTLANKYADLISVKATRMQIDHPSSETHQSCRTRTVSGDVSASDLMGEGPVSFLGHTFERDELGKFQLKRRLNSFDTDPLCSPQIRG